MVAGEKDEFRAAIIELDIYYFIVVSAVCRLQRSIDIASWSFSLRIRMHTKCSNGKSVVHRKADKKK